MKNMYSRDQQTMPPLWIWLCLLFAVCGTAALLYFVERNRYRQEAASLRSYILNGSKAAAGKPLIIVFGTSLSECGLDSSRKLERAIGDAYGRPVTVLKIWKHAATLASFDDLAETFKKLQPEYIVIEANMFFYKFPQEFILTKYINTFREIVSFSKTPHTYLPDARFFYRNRTPGEVDAGRVGLVDTTVLSSFRGIVSLWQQRGSHLLLFNFPLESGLEIKKWNGPDTTGFNHNLHYFRERCDFEYIDPMLRLDSSYYFDHAHMNSSGSEKLSAFFCQVMADQLKSQ